MKSARLGKTTAFDVPCRKNLKRDTKEQTYNLKRDSENSNTEGASKKKKKERKRKGRDELGGRDLHIHRICRCNR